jgi:hypothetical protein
MICLRYGRKHEIKENVNINLPPEGQPEEAVVQGYVFGLGVQNVKHWKQGLVAKHWHRWLGQEKLEIMVLSLERRYDIMRQKENIKKQQIWEEEINVGTWHPPNSGDIWRDGQVRGNLGAL